MNIDKVRLKGDKNKNNPNNDIRRADEILIVKKPNYTDCLTGFFCINDNRYKVYNVTG